MSKFGKWFKAHKKDILVGSGAVITGLLCGIALCYKPDDGFTNKVSFNKNELDSDQFGDLGDPDIFMTVLGTKQSNIEAAQAQFIDLAHEHDMTMRIDTGYKSI